MSELPQNYNWLSEEDYTRLRFETRRHFARILSGLRKWYGQADEVDGAVAALFYVTEQTWDIVRGKSRPIKAPKHFNRYDDSKYEADQ